MRSKIATSARVLFLLGMSISGGGAAVIGCQENPPPPPPRHVRVPPPGEGPMREIDPPRPLPEQRAAEDPADDVPPPPFVDEPLVIEATPEQRAYVHAYEDVGRPTLAVFVNRSFDAEPLGHDKPGYSNELGTHAIDYEAIENVLMDWLAADGKVEIISPTGVRERLGDGTARDLESGKLKSGDAGRKLNADVVVQVRAQITRQTPQGPEVRLVAEAINVRGGQSIARAVVDVPPPLTKQQIDHYTRFVARKLMNGMIGSWQHFASEPPAGSRGDAKNPDRDAPPPPQPAPPQRSPELRPDSAPAPTPAPAPEK